MGGTLSRNHNVICHSKLNSANDGRERMKRIARERTKHRSFHSKCERRRLASHAETDFNILHALFFRPSPSRYSLSSHWAETKYRQSSWLEENKPSLVRKLNGTSWQFGKEIDVIISGRRMRLGACQLLLFGAHAQQVCFRFGDFLQPATLELVVFTKCCLWNVFLALLRRILLRTTRKTFKKRTNALTRSCFPSGYSRGQEARK